jgi:hypothetical protein
MGGDNEEGSPGDVGGVDSVPSSNIVDGGVNEIVFSYVFPRCFFNFARQISLRLACMAWSTDFQVHFK